MNKEQLEMLILAGDILVERLTEGETLYEIAEREWNEELEEQLQNALLQGLESLREWPQRVQGMREHFEAKLDAAVNSFVNELEGAK
jgi:uncharacterized lipoprotein YmbA